jgi:hypothetical protein
VTGFIKIALLAPVGLVSGIVIIEKKDSPFNAYKENRRSTENGENRLG